MADMKGSQQENHFEALLEKIDELLESSDKHDLENLIECSYVDPEVFAAMPQEIQKEILQSLYDKGVSNTGIEDKKVQHLPFSSMRGTAVPSPDLTSEPSYAFYRSNSMIKGDSMMVLPSSSPPPSANSTPDLNKDCAYLSDSDDKPTTSKAAEKRRLTKDMKKVFREVMDTKFIMSWPENIRQEIAADMAKLKLNSNSLLGDTRVHDWFDKNTITKESLTGWIEDFVEPNLDDIQFCLNYCFYLIEDHDICELFDKLAHICRIIMKVRETSCAWHTVFRVLITFIQEQMVKVNQTKMLFNLDLNCDICSTLPVKETTLWFKIKSSTD